MRRRTWFSLALLSLAGCSSSNGGRTKKTRSPSAKKGPKGPKTMGNLLVQGYIDDLKNGTVDSRIAAAKELGAMGSNAKSALPALQPLTTHSDAKLSAAARQAISLIKK